MHSRKENISIGKIKVSVEIANCSQSRRKGLMNRVTLDENSGMLFVFTDSKPRSFWMHETYLPLSIAYINDASIITEIQRMVPLNLNSIKSSSPVRFALEMNEGWFSRNNIVVGDKIRIPSTFLLESNLRHLFKKLISESFEEIVSIDAKLRISINKRSDPKLQDILTDIRGIKNVITVKQIDRLYPAQEGKQWANLIIAFEDDDFFDIQDLERELRIISGVDLVSIKTYDRKPIKRIR